MASADRNAKLSVYSCPPFCDLIQSSELHIQSGLVGRMEAVNQGSLLIFSNVLSGVTLTLNRG